MSPENQLTYSSFNPWWISNKPFPDAKSTVQEPDTVMTEFVSGCMEIKVQPHRRTWHRIRKASSEFQLRALFQDYLKLGTWSVRSSELSSYFMGWICLCLYQVE